MTDTPWAGLLLTNTYWLAACNLAFDIFFNFFVKISVSLCNSLKFKCLPVRILARMACVNAVFLFVWFKWLQTPAQSVFDYEIVSQNVD